MLFGGCGTRKGRFELVDIPFGFINEVEFGPSDIG
jgi:hypothetical protein